MWRVLRVFADSSEEYEIKKSNSEDTTQMAKPINNDRIIFRNHSTHNSSFQSLDREPRVTRDRYPPTLNPTVSGKQRVSDTNNSLLFPHSKKKGDFYFVLGGGGDITLGWSPLAIDFEPIHYCTS